MKTAVRLRMVLLPLVLALLLTFLTSFSVGVYALSQPGANLSLEKHQQLANPNTAMLTYKNDIFHSGANRNETSLTLSNVNPLQFGKRATFPTDGQVYAQPLFMPNVTIGGVSHNVVFVETENDTIYAFDADSSDPATAVLWKTSFLGGANNAVAVASADVNCNDLNPIMGITSTPVINAATGTMYIVAFTKENGQLVYRLHALDITTGTDKARIVISGSVPGTGQGSSGGKIAFDPKHERQRANLLLDPANNQIYMAFASFCDITPYHGWVIGYSFSNNIFAQTAIYNDTPDGGFGGIWGGGGTLTADTAGNLFFTTGNGTFHTNASDLGDSFVKLSPTLHLLDYFTPFNQICLEGADADLGAGGVLLIPARNEAFGAGKEGRLYVLNMAHMGHFTSPPGGFSCSNQTATNIDNVTQEFPPHALGGMFSTPSTWSNGTKQYVYIGSAGQPLKAYVLNTNGTLSLVAQASDIVTRYFSGSTVISSNGNSNGIVWMFDPTGLRAYDATNITHELYVSARNASRDTPTGAMTKFSTPTVANGEVFVATQSALNIYGLLPNTAGNNVNNVGITNDTNAAPGNFDGGGHSYSAQALQSVGVVAGQTVNAGGFAFQWPGAQPGTPDNWYALGQTVAVNSTSGDNVLGVLGAADFGASSGTATMNFTDGTSQTFTLGLTDWWKWQTPSFSNQLVVSMPYQNTASGKLATAVGVFLARAQIPAGKTLQSVVLPSNASGGQMHIFAFATQKVSTGSFNNVGVSDDSAPKAGNFDGSGHSYSAQALASVGIAAGNTLHINGYTLQWPNVQPGSANNWLAKGQTILLSSSAGNNMLGILGAAEFGAASGTATMNFTDGTSQTFTLGFTDWWKWQTPTSGNVVVSVAPYQNSASGKLATSVGLFLAEVAIPGGKILASIVLPATTSGGHLHIFSMATRTTSGSDFNNVGVSNDLAPTLGSFDGTGRSYSAQALTSAGVTAGGTVNTTGYTFQWPNCLSGTLNNWLASGQTITVAQVSGATTLGMLGAATFGASSGTATMHFTDGTSQTFTLGFTDWWKWQTPSFSNGVVVTTLYQNTASGKLTTVVGLFLAEVAIPGGEVLASVTLPASLTGGKMHVFALATKAAAATSSSNVPKGKSSFSSSITFVSIVRSRLISRQRWML